MSDQYQTSMVTTQAEHNLLMATVLLPGVRVWNNYTKKLHLGDGATAGGQVVGNGPRLLATGAGRQATETVQDGTVLAASDPNQAGNAAGSGGAFVGTATKGAPRRFQGTLVPSGDDCGYCIGRDVQGDRLFSHAFRDESTFSSTNDSAYTSYDAIPQYNANGGTKYNHGYGYQWRGRMNSPSGMGAFAGHTSYPVLLQGQTDSLNHFWVQGTTLAGGTVVNNHGYHCSPLPGSSFGVYVEANPSYMGGALQIGGALTGVTTAAIANQLNAKCGNFTGGPESYVAGGGLLVQGQGGAAGYRTLYAYSDVAGTVAGLSVRSNNILLGTAVPASGTAIEFGGVATPAVDNSYTLGNASFRFSTIYAGTATINTSDERLKREIGDVPDEWLDAWGTVQWQRYKFVDGERWHVGLIAQRVHTAFADAGLDAFEIGLCCYDEWDSISHEIMEPRKATRTVDALVPSGVFDPDSGNELFTVQQVDEEYEVLEPTGQYEVTQEAGDRWGLRYTECFAMEAAYNRRELARLSAALTALQNNK